MPLRRLGAVVALAGVGMMAAPLVFSLLTNVETAQQQRAEQARWEQQLEAGRRAPSPAERPSAAPRAAPPSPAAPPFMLSIPKIDLRWLIREGTSIPHLRRHGAGHIPGTAAPGRTGVVGIAGHRTTYGAPFFRLNRLGPGDEVTLRTRDGTFVYRVFHVQQVRPTQVEILRPRGNQRLLVLVTCSPPFSAAFRLAVFAALASQTASAP